MVRQVDHGWRISHGIVGHGDFLMRDGIGDASVDGAGEAHVAVRAVHAKFDYCTIGVIGQNSAAPNLSIKSMRTPVQGVALAICVEAKPLSIQYKGRTGDAVGVAAQSGTQVRIAGYVGVITRLRQ